MIYIYSFCVFINRISKDHLEYTCNLLINSLLKSDTKFKLIIFSNFTINIKNNENVEVRNYIENKMGNVGDKWWLLSFNKLYTWKTLYDETKQNFIWTDLDNIICTNIDYIEKLDNLFLENGGHLTNNPTFFSNNNNYKVNQSRYIQVNFFKLNIQLYNSLMDCYTNDIIKKKLKLRFDSQDLFNYYIHSIVKLKDINILGFNIYQNTVNGLCVWSEKGLEHPNINGLQKLYYENNMLKSKYYPLKDIHILSFTFFRLTDFLKCNKIEFNEKFGHIINYNDNDNLNFNNLHSKLDDLIKNLTYK